MFGMNGRKIKILESFVDELRMEVDTLKSEYVYLGDNQVHINNKVSRSVKDAVCRECGCIIMALPSLQVVEGEYECCRCSRERERDVLR